MSLGGPEDPTSSYASGVHWAGDDGPVYSDASAWHTAPAHSEMGRALGGRYELGHLLGRGGMADVHLAHDARLDRSVAVKTLRSDLAQDPEFQARFRREAQSAASLNHPAIAAVYDTGEDVPYDGLVGGTAPHGGLSLPYIVMEYIDGFTLSELLRSGRTLSPQHVLETALDVLRALEHAHRSGIVHRDIKPANVMLTHAGQVKVMDFGIARDVRDVGLTQTSVVVGTAQYLSPEQAMGLEADARSDLYSLGCLLYELLTFRPPFTGDSPMAVMYQHVQEAPRPPSHHNPAVTPETDALVLRALAKQPELRPQSADEMRAEVEFCLGGGPSPVTAAFPSVTDEDGEARGFADDMDLADDTDEEPTNGSDKKAAVLLGTAALLVVAGALLIGWLMFGGHRGADTATVPDLVSETLDDARIAADNVGLTVTVDKSAPCEDQPKDHICSQTPESGEVDKGTAIHVVVSTGSPKIEVPDITDKDEDDASRILEDKGFKVKTRHVESEEDPGTVLEQDPAGGRKVEKGTEITLTVAKASDRSTVPDLTGKTVTEAERLLTEHDLTLGGTTEVEADEGTEAGTVVGQSIRQGTEVEPGSSVDIEVAKRVETVRIPAGIVGKTLAEARSDLRSLGLQVSVASDSSSAADAVVTSTIPQAGSEVAAGSTVTVVTEAPSDEASTTPSDPSTPPADEPAAITAAR
ncbi:Stk1 family PASTA domain-containing Ser/Thr kinase [Streptomyces antibioticus]|uniref:Stk1 family PASTA domain-containing Ser/Thr kinase n=1 Tax=Streptomyces antibioticus TaxID=1890 RepID=UPI0033B3473D